VGLAPYACQSPSARGRRFPEVPAPTRNDFQRDRDRVIHSTAFRRLVYKTQVFVNHEGDLFRTRLTHSLEVAQLGRSIARSLRLNEDLVEAVSLAHDLGHTPFGHAGQDALNACLLADTSLTGADTVPNVATPSPGFEHNLQSLRVVDELEERYPSFNGLNLCFETREGILKHCSRANARWLEASEPGGVGSRFLAGTQPSLEAQLCNLADEIAYNAHDVDDGVRSGLLTLDMLETVPLFRCYQLETLRDHPQLTGRRLLFESIRRMLSAQVYDVIEASRVALARAGVDSLEGVRRSGPLLVFSDDMKTLSQGLKSFLLSALYRHPQVMATTDQARAVVATLYRTYLDTPTEMKAGAWAQGRPLQRAVADYIAGMTDRFAIREHERLTGRMAFA
jgi:dGTPase